MEYDLDTTTRGKPVLNVDDIFLILHHHWTLDDSIFPDERQRLQLAFLVLISSYTGTRPRALVYKAVKNEKLKAHYLGCEGSDFDSTMDWDPEDVRTVYYEDVTLILLPDPDGFRDKLAMEITLKYTKGWQKKPKP